jgi:Fe-S-cluster containining protein
MSCFKYKKTKVDKSIKKLNNIYSELPETKGCLENINKEPGCGAYCCKIQYPTMQLIEWLNLWRYVNKEWSNEEFFEILEKALRLFFSNRVIKPCLFFDDKKKICKVHKKRPFMCRAYGLMPHEGFNARVEQLREYYKDDLEAVFKDQCDLVETVTGESEISQAQLKNFISRIDELEKEIGIDSKMMSDDVGGTNRAPHDHLLLHLLPEHVIQNISKVKQFGEEEEKEATIQVLLNILKQAFEEKDSEEESG